MILRVNIAVPKAAAYVVGVERIPDHWLGCTLANLDEFARRRPGWSYYVAGGLDPSWRGIHLLHEAEISRWP